MTPQVTVVRKEMIRVILPRLRRLFPDAGMILKYSNNWELLVAVMLSAQCTDKKVNEVTEKLFKKYPTLDDYINADVKEFENDIFQTGFYHSKAKHVLATARIIKEKFGGSIPQTIEELITLPGVARKTANVVLGNAYGIFEGIAVDTHVKRISRRLHLTDEENPDKIERDLMSIVPRKNWFEFTYLLIEYGRRYCTARRHDHTQCPLTSIVENYI